MKTQPLLSRKPLALCLALIGGCAPALAQTTLSTVATSDTFLSSDPNYDSSDLSAYGAMMISANLPDTVQGITTPRTMDSLVAYNTASIASQFNTEYGAGNWQVTSVQVEFYSNFDILGTPANNNMFNVPAAGQFTLSYIPDNAWFNPSTAGAQGLANSDLNWNSVFGTNGTYSNLLNGAQSLGTFSYTGGSYNGTTNCVSTPCDHYTWNLSLSSGLVSSIESGSYVSLFGAAADNQISYLINQMTKPGAQPEILITAAPVPEATSTIGILIGLASLGALQWGRRHTA